MKTATYVLILLAALLVAGTASATNSQDCWYGVVDVASVWGTDPDGTIWISITYYMGWQCTDGLLDDERPHDEPLPGGGTSTNPPPPAPPPGGCSLSGCLEDCNEHYLEHAGVEVIGGSYLYHVIDFECGVYCQEAARTDWEACNAMCTTDCTLL